MNFIDFTDWFVRNMDQQIEQMCECDRLDLNKN
jgi:hypothetical protein